MDNSWIWFLPLVMATSLAMLFAPLFSRRGAAPLPVGLEGNPRVALENRRDLLLRQLKELDLETDKESGKDSGQDFRRELESELGEIWRRLDSEPDASDDKANDPRPASTEDRALAIAVMAVVTAVTAGLYLHRGTPTAVPPSQESAHAMPQDINLAINGLATRLRSNPDDRAGWDRLARSLGAVGRFTEAVDAYAHILSRQPDDEESALALVELLLTQDDPLFARSAVRLLDRMLVQNPDREEALWYRGVLAFKAGELDSAERVWQRLLALLPAESPNRPTVQSAMETLITQRQGRGAPQQPPP
ncbi:MAG: tetratricopeptide repeat protein [Magnetococcales bacterium]|nr:tetratricopeptide repeat protein [Magnetococcales bacterium]